MIVLRYVLGYFDLYSMLSEGLFGCWESDLLRVKNKHNHLDKLVN